MTASARSRSCEQSEQDLRTITDAIRQSIVVLAPDGTTLYANQVALDRTGLTLGEANDHGFFTRVFHPDDADRLLAERQQGLSHGAPFELESRVRHRNGEYRWQLIQYNPLIDEQGRMIAGTRPRPTSTTENRRRLKSSKPTFVSPRPSD